MTAGGEWRRYGTLPVVAALGYATSVIHIYGLGPYIEPISADFGWTRAQTTVGLTVATLVQALCSVPIGLAVDRIGPRRLGLFGAMLTLGAFALLGSASGTTTNWVALWFAMALATLPVQATVWTGAVASRFSQSRGLAFAVTLCGASVAQALFPWLGTVLIAEYGWRQALPVQAGVWAVIALPAIIFFFKGAQDGPAEIEIAVERQGAEIAEALGSTIYWRLLIASLFFTFTILGLVVHFIPILKATGVDAVRAAGLASVIGLCSIFGRLGTGLMLDRFRASIVGAAAFLLPALACLTLWLAGQSGWSAALAAGLIGLTLGAEIDVIVYLTTGHFGLKHFGALYGGMLAALSIGTATGPLAAAYLFDISGNYTNFLMLAIALMLVSSLAILSLPRPKYGAHTA